MVVWGRLKKSQLFQEPRQGQRVREPGLGHLHRGRRRSRRRRGRGSNPWQPRLGTARDRRVRGGGAQDHGPGGPGICLSTSASPLRILSLKSLFRLSELSAMWPGWLVGWHLVAKQFTEMTSCQLGKLLKGPYWNNGGRKLLNENPFTLANPPW